MIKKLGNIYGKTGGSFAGNVYSKSGICPCIRTGGGGNQQPMVIVHKNIYVLDGYNSKVIENHYIGTLTTNCGQGSMRSGWKLIFKRGKEQ